MSIETPSPAPLSSLRCPSQGFSVGLQHYMYLYPSKLDLVTDMFREDSLKLSHSLSEECWGARLVFLLNVVRSDNEGEQGARGHVSGVSHSVVNTSPLVKQEGRPGGGTHEYQ